MEVENFSSTSFRLVTFAHRFFPADTKSVCFAVIVVKVDFLGSVATTLD